jgi:hypothetical protein
MERDILIPYTYNLNVASGTTRAQIDQYVSSIENKVVEALNQALCYTAADNKDEQQQNDQKEQQKRSTKGRGYRVSAVGYSSYPPDKVEGSCGDENGGLLPNVSGMCQTVVGAATLRIFQAETSTLTAVDSFRCAASQSIYELMQDNDWDDSSMAGIAYTEATTAFTCQAADAAAALTSSSPPTTSSSSKETLLGLPLAATSFIVASAAAITVAVLLAVVYSTRLPEETNRSSCGSVVNNFSSRDSLGCSTIIAANLSCSRSSRDDDEMEIPGVGSWASRRIMQSHSDASRQTLQSRNVRLGSGGSGLGGSECTDRYNTFQEQEERQQKKEHWRAAAAMAAAAAYSDEYDFDEDDGDYDDISDSDIYTTPDRSSAMMSPSTRSDVSWMCAALDGGGGSHDYGDIHSPHV